MASEQGRGELARLVKLARDGDSQAKHDLVGALKRLAWAATATFRMSSEDREDVFASTFCRLFENLGTIRDPERIAGWIVTTARNEAYTLLRSRGRLVVTEELGESKDPGGEADEQMLDEELRVAVRAAFETLPPGCRDLLRLLTAEPRLSYDEIGEVLDMPHGSIGPTRRRCLDRLRSTAQLQPFMEGGQR